MITVHHLENSRSQRVLWLLEELGLPYEITRYKRDPVTSLAPESLRKIHPLGKSPLVTDEGRVLAESGAIVEYLVDTYAQGRLVPLAGTPARLRYTYWLHYAEGSATPPLLLKLMFNKVRSAPVPFFVKPITKMIADKAFKTFIDPQIALHFDYVESELGKHQWFAGEDFTAADVQMSYPLEAFAARSGDDKHPRITTWIAKVHARPAYARALERGGPYELMS